MGTIKNDYDVEASVEEINRWTAFLDQMEQFSEDVMDCCEVVSLDTVKTFTNRRSMEDVVVDLVEFNEVFDHEFRPEEVIETMYEGGFGLCTM